MVGGMVSIVTPKKDSIEVQCVGSGSERYDRVATQVRDTPEARKIRPGDNLWWHSRKAFWTPRCNQNGGQSRRQGVDFDIPLERVGYSYRPKASRRRE